MIGLDMFHFVEIQISNGLSDLFSDEHRLAQHTIGTLERWILTIHTRRVTRGEDS